MIYDLLDQTKMNHKKKVFIPKSKVLEMYSDIKESKEVSGFIYGIVKRK